MRTKTAASMLAILAVMIIGVGGSAASASPEQARTEHLRIMSTKATAEKLSVIATGVITAGGIDVPGKVADVIRFPGGAFTFRHHSHSFTSTFDPRTCLLTETQKGAFTIGHGTGHYAGIHGSGKFVTSIVAVTAKNHAGQCIHAQAPGTFQAITTAIGTVSR